MDIGLPLNVIIAHVLLLGGLHRQSDHQIHHNGLPAGPHPTPPPTAHAAGVRSLHACHQHLLKEVLCALQTCVFQLAAF